MAAKLTMMASLLGQALLYHLSKCTLFACMCLRNAHRAISKKYKLTKLVTFQQFNNMLISHYHKNVIGKVSNLDICFE